MDSTTPLIGRRQALAQLRAATAGARGGGGGLVLVAGDAGIGKSALLAHLAAESDTDGVPVSWGRAVDGLGSPPYWLWTQVLRDVGALTVDAHLGDTAEPDDGAGADRFALVEQLLLAMEGATDKRARLVLLEDLHQADLDSLRLLDLVRRSLEGRRVTIVGSYRPGEADDWIIPLAGAAHVVPLEGLPLEATRELMRELTGADVEDSVAARMQRRTGGNPFFVRELTRLSELRRDSRRPWGSFDMIPSVRDVLERRLARLSQPCAQVLVTAAVAGAVLRPWLLRQVHPGEDLERLIDEALRQRILIADPGGVGFVHDLFREVLTAGLPQAARQQTHRAVGDALAAGRRTGRTVHVAELASHYCTAALLGDEEVAGEAMRYAREAARESRSRLAFDDAAAHLERALAVLDTTDVAAPRRLELLLEAGAAQQAAGRPQSATTTFQEAWSVAEAAAEPTAQARAALGLHGIGVKTGPSRERDAQARMLETTSASVASADPLLAMEVRAALARTLYHSLEPGRMDRARQVARATVAMARDHADVAALESALRALHDVSWSPGTAVQRLRLLDEVERLHGVRDRGVDLLRAQALLELGDPEGRVLVTEACEEAALSGRPDAAWFAASRRAAVALLAGRLEEAEARIEEAERIATRIGDDDSRWIADIQRWELARFTGGRASFLRHRPDGEPRVEQWPPWASLILADAGRDEEATRALDGFTAAEAHGPAVRAGYDLWFPAIAAEAAARHGTDRLRADLYELLAPYAGTQVGCGAWVAYSGPVELYLADLAVALGDVERASGHFQRAEGQVMRLEAPLWRERIVASRGRQAERTQANTFTKEGAFWTLSFRGVRTVVPDAKGLRDLALLLSHPHEPISVATLVGAGPQPGGDLVLDRRALSAYRSRIADLDEQIDTAEAEHDNGRSTRARAEREAVLEELKRSTALGGRVRRLGDDSERIRKTVRARLHRTLHVIENQHPALGAHLLASIDTGSWCTYRPAEPLTWQVRS